MAGRAAGIGGIPASGELGVFEGGRWKATLSGSCAVGAALGTSADGTNMVKTINPALSGQRILCFALETGTTGQTIFVRQDMGRSPAL